MWAKEESLRHCMLGVLLLLLLLRRCAVCAQLVSAEGEAVARGGQKGGWPPKS